MAANGAFMNLAPGGLLFPLLMPSILGPNFVPFMRYDFEAAHEEIQSLMAGMDPDSFNEITEFLSVRQQVLNSRKYVQALLKLARARSTKLFHAPDPATTDESLLAPLSSGFDVYHQSDYNKVVTVLVGSKKHQLKFTAISGALAAEADFFKPLCDDRWKCGRARVIELENHQPETFAIFITWLYTRDHTDAEGLVKVCQYGHDHSTFRIRKSSHKKRWFQLLHCYFLADYIGAPQFANHIMDALIFAYKDWVEDNSFHKVLKEPIFEDRETEQLVEENTTDLSPLRLLVDDILSPFLVLRSPEASTSFLERFRRPVKFQNHSPLPSQDSAFSMPSHHAHPNHGNILYSMHTPDALPDLPPSHPVPSHLQIPPPQYNILDPALFETPHPSARSRFNSMFHLRSDSEDLAMNLMKSEYLKKIWEGSRCKYHIHKQGKDCSGDVVLGIS